MRSFETWVDYRGQTWQVAQGIGRLKFRVPCHAALRAHIFHIDGYKCRRCPAQAINVPADYDGASAMQTNTFTGSGFPDMLVLDHIVTRKAGGRNHVGNLQTLCETCNKKKMPEDILAAKKRRAS